jgi:hypothetical protein
VQNLVDALAAAGSSGSSAAIRALYRSGDAARGREAYRAQLLGERAWALDALADAAAERPTAMLCLEADRRADTAT